MSAGLITAGSSDGFDRLSAALTAQARAIATAWLASQRLAAAGDPARWRRATLLWPGFGGPPSWK